MNGWLIAVTALFSLSTASASSATEVVPAWQEPGFVMEEVVATATAEDVANAWREQMHRRARILVAHLARADLPE